MAKRGTIDDFKANVASDFARPNLFQVDLAFPSGILQNADLVNLGKFTVRAANLPSSQIGVIEVPFRGRTLKIAGDRTFEPWTITMIVDLDYALHLNYGHQAFKHITRTSHLLRVLEILMMLLDTSRT